MFRKMNLVALVAVVSVMGMASQSFAQSSPKVDQKADPKVGLIPNPSQKPLRQIGLQVVLVFPESPAARVGIESGDIIVRVNGVRVRSQADLTSALTRAGRVTRLEVLDCNTGRPSEVTVNPIMGRIGVQTTPVPVGDYRPTPPYFGLGEQLGQ